MSAPLAYGSVCSGIEAASVAWHPLGWRRAFFSEIESFPRAVLRHHYPDVPLHGDFTTIEAEQYEPIDLLVGGTPCQDFSVAGLRAGITGERGKLTVEFVHLARRLRPRWLVWENVPGILSIDGGLAFGAFLGLLGQCGYGFAYRVLDAQYFGVPQRRRRVFVVGHLGDWRRAAAVLFERESLSGHPPPRREAGERVAQPIAAGSPTSYRVDADTAENLIAFGIDSDCIDRSGEGAGATAGERSGLGITVECSSALRSKRPNAVAFGGNDTRGSIDVATAVNAHGGPHGWLDFESETFIAHSLRADGFDASEDGTGRGTPLVPVAMQPAIASFKWGMGAKAGGIGYAEEQAGSIDTNATLHGVQHGMAVRRLTPRECERLQGFPDGWTDVPYRGKPAADGPRYKALGNSMCVNVMRWLGERIAMVEQIAAGNALPLTATS